VESNGRIERSDSTTSLDAPLKSVMVTAQVPRYQIEDSVRRAIDVTELVNRPPRPQIIDDIWPVKSIIALAAEEGDGKTLMADQILRQALRGERVLGFFDVGEAGPRRVLFVDTEMEEEDAVERNAEMVGRGLGIDEDQFYWFTPGGLMLDKEDDFKLLCDEVARVRPDVV
jgi:hypothetical protein